MPCKVKPPAWYSWQIRGVGFDFYQLVEALRLVHPAQVHALKKVLRAGAGEKPVIQDIDEAIISLKRWREMVLEDARPLDRPGTGK